MELFEVQPESTKAVEGYNTTLLLASNGFNLLSTPSEFYFLLRNQTSVSVDEQFNPDCECWLTHQTTCYHNATSCSNLNKCCRSVVTLHILPRVNWAGSFYGIWYDKQCNYTATASMCK